jgi:hypothetical protein
MDARELYLAAGHRRKAAAYAVIQPPPSTRSPS